MKKSVDVPDWLKPSQLYKNGKKPLVSITDYKRSAKEHVRATIVGRELLQKNALRTWDLCYRYGPLTGSEVDELSRRLNGVPLTAYGTTFRLLEAAGCLRRVGRQYCRLTRALADAWDVTDQLPITVQKTRKPPSPKKRTRRLFGIRPDTTRLFRVGAQLDTFSRGADRIGATWSLDAQAVIAWLKKGAPDDDVDKLADWKSRGAPTLAIAELSSWLKLQGHK